MSSQGNLNFRKVDMPVDGSRRNGEDSLVIYEGGEKDEQVWSLSAGTVFDLGIDVPADENYAFGAIFAYVSVGADGADILLNGEPVGSKLDQGVYAVSVEKGKEEGAKEDESIKKK